MPMGDIHDFSQLTIPEDASGYFDLGMLQEAWETLLDLPPLQRISRQSIAIRLGILMEIGGWDALLDLSEAFTESFPEWLEPWYYLGICKLLAGDREGAKKIVEKLFEIDEEWRSNIYGLREVDGALKPSCLSWPHDNLRF